MLESITTCATDVIRFGPSAGRFAHTLLLIESHQHNLMIQAENSLGLLSKFADVNCSRAMCAALIASAALRKT